MLGSETQKASLAIPVLSGTRLDARRIVAEMGDVQGSTVDVDAHECLASTPHFADELIRQLLIERRARHVTVHHPGTEFGAQLNSSIDEHGVRGRVTINDVKPCA